MKRLKWYLLAGTVTFTLGSSLGAGPVFAQQQQQPTQLAQPPYHDKNIVQDAERQAEQEFLQKEFPQEYREIQRLAGMDNALNRRIHANLRHIADLHHELQAKLNHARLKQPSDPREIKQLEEQVQHFEDKYKHFRNSIEPQMQQLKLLFDQRRQLHQSYISNYQKRDKQAIKHVLQQWLQNGNETIIVKQKILKRMQGETVL